MAIFACSSCQARLSAPVAVAANPSFQGDLTETNQSNVNRKTSCTITTAGHGRGLRIKSVLENSEASDTNVLNELPHPAVLVCSALKVKKQNETKQQKKNVLYSLWTIGGTVTCLF